jgi:hypothetical protein
LELTLTNFKPHSSGNHQHPYLPGIILNQFSSPFFPFF